MKLKLMTLALALAMAGSSALSAHTDTDWHQPDYRDEKYVKTTQDGTYVHTFITGINPITGTITYGRCEVTCETEYYTRQCGHEGCYATDGKLYPKTVETHSKCPL